MQTRRQGLIAFEQAVEIAAAALAEIRGLDPRGNILRAEAHTLASFLDDAHRLARARSNGAGECTENWESV